MDDDKKVAKITNLDTLDEFLTNRDNSINALYLSDIPDVCKSQPCIMGIDEAGRGPVLGPMVYGTSFCTIDDEDLLKTLHCADSKALNEEQRDEIFSNICTNSNKIGWCVDVISPQFICNNMLSRTKYSLNQISMDSAINLIKTVRDAGVRIEHIYVDTVGKPDKYQTYLKSIFPDFKITVAKKADSTYPIVSAASICAKVTRDHALKTWKFAENIDITQQQFGSGYPSDPATKKFLKDYCDNVFGYPQLVRFSWSTTSEALKEAYYVEWDDSEEIVGEDETHKTTTITSYFKMTPKKGIKRQEHEFFTQRGLSRKVEF